MVTSRREVAIVLARGGSKGVPRKNVRTLLGAPLISWTIRQVRDAGIEELFVSTDDSEIAEIAEHEGARTIKRPSHLAGDDATSESALFHAVEHLGLSDEDSVLMPQITSPLRRPGDVRAVLELVHSGAFDSAFSGNRIDDICVWQVDEQPRPITYDPGSRKTRQKRGTSVVENGSLYCMTAGLLRHSGVRLGGRIGIHYMPPWTIHEIDEHDDFKLCEALMLAYMADDLQRDNRGKD